MAFNTNTDRDLAAIQQRLAEIIELLKTLQHNTTEPTPLPTKRKQK